MYNAFGEHGQRIQGRRQLHEGYLFFSHFSMKPGKCYVPFHFMKLKSEIIEIILMYHMLLFKGKEYALKRFAQS